MEVETGKNGTVSLGELRAFLLRDITAGTEEQIQLIFDRMDTRQRRTVAWDLNFSFFIMERKYDSLLTTVDACRCE